MDDGYVPLEQEDCLALLAAAGLGRVVFTVHALPAVVPVAYSRLDDGSLVLGTPLGAPLAGALHGTVVALEAEQVDGDTMTGWSVVVHGRAQTVRDPAVIEELLRSGPPARGEGGEAVFVRIVPELATGGRLASIPPPR